MVRRESQASIVPRIGAGVASLMVAFSLAGCQLTKAAAPTVEPDLASTMSVGGALGEKQVDESSKAIASAEEARSAAEEEAQRLSRELEVAQAEAQSAETRATVAEEDAAQARAAQSAAEAKSAKDAEIEAAFPSWNADSAALKKLVAFVDDVCDEKSDNFVPVEDRVATFDMDGTIMSETAPIYMDWMLLLHRVLDDPTYTPDSEMREFCEGLRDNWSEAFHETDADRRKNYDLTVAFRGMTPEEFRGYVENFISTTNVIGFSNMTYGESLYQPMVEVISYLKDHDFNVYMVTACERDVTRAFVKSSLDIPYDHVIGVDFSLATDKQGSAQGSDYNMGQDEVVYYSGWESEARGKMNKVVGIEHEIGTRPILAFGNSSGDFSMLNYAQGNPKYKGMGVLVINDDTKRDYGDAEESADYMKNVTKEGWTAFSKRDDWATIYKEGVEKTSIGTSLEMTTTSGNTDQTGATDSAETTETTEVPQTTTVTEGEAEAEPAESESADQGESQAAAKTAEEGEVLDLGSGSSNTNDANRRVKGNVVVSEQVAA